jgi:hypothetical protein
MPSKICNLCGATRENIGNNGLCTVCTQLRASVWLDLDKLKEALTEQRTILTKLQKITEKRLVRKN